MPPKHTIFLDVETSRFQRKASLPHYSPANFSEFLKTTRDPAKWARSNYGIAHTGGQIYQMYANMPMYQTNGVFDASKTFIAEAGHAEVSDTGFRFSPGPSDFSKQTGIFAASKRHGFWKDPVTGQFAFGQLQRKGIIQLESGLIFNLSPFETGEAAKIAEFMENLTYRAQNGGVRFAAHNPLFDISAIQHALFKYPSLAKYRTRFADLHQAGKFSILPMESPYLKILWRYGQYHKNFGSVYLRDMSTGLRVTDPDSLRAVPGWAAQKLVEQFGLDKDPKLLEKSARIQSQLGQGLGAHEATHDIEVFTKPLQEKLTLASKEIEDTIAAGGTPDFAKILRGHFPHMRGNAQEVFSTLAGSHQNVEFFKTLAAAEKKGAAVREEFELIKKVPKGIADNRHLILGALAAAFIAKIVSEDSRARKTQISGLQDEGIRQWLRHERTDFGSGYRPDEERPSLGLAAFIAAGAGAIALHRYKLANSPEYASKVFKVIKNVFEYKSPLHIASTYRLSEVASSYIPRSLEFESCLLHWEDIAKGTSVKSLLGEQFQKIFGDAIDVTKLEGKLRFEQTAVGSPWHRLVEATAREGDQLVSAVPHNEQLVRFMENGKIAGSAFRFHMPTEAAHLFESSWSPPPIQRFMGARVPDVARPYVEKFLAARRAKFPTNPKILPGLGYGLDVESKLHFVPVYGKKASDSFVKQVYDRASFINYHLLERGHETMARTLGIGFKRGTVPTNAKMMASLLGKVVLPAYAVWTGARYLDYLTGHAVRNTAAAVAAKTHLAYAAATDMVPGLRQSADFNKDVLPGPKYGPLALPAGGAFIGGAIHYGRVVSSKNILTRAERALEARKFVGRGALIGAALAAPFALGMIGSRKPFDQLQREYSGVDMVPVRAGRWWDAGNESYEGGKISFFLPNWYRRLTSSSFVKGNFSEDEGEYWSHNPLLHPLKYLKDPYWLEKRHYRDRPFPITSPAFTNVPLVGDFLAATIGKVIKPPTLMHKGEWSDTDYQLGGPKLNRGAKPGEKLAEEYGVTQTFRRQAERFFDWSGLPGYHMKTAFNALVGEDTTPYMQGSRQMNNLSRFYYERQLGAMAFVGMDQIEQVGYSEPLRRFITTEPKTIQINEIPNTMPGWLPGEGEYAINFRAGDPYSRIAYGYLRLPGPGYEAIHPELKSEDPEAYPAITKLSILADVAPTSTKFFYYKGIVEKQAQTDIGLQIELDRITERVEQQQKSAIHASKRKFTESAEQIKGTVEEATPEGVRLEEYPGRLFQFSGVGLSAADMAAASLREHNLATRGQVNRLTMDKYSAAGEYLAGRLKPGTQVQVTTPAGAPEHALEIPAVFRAGGEVINRELIDAGYGTDKIRDAGPEAQAMFGKAARAYGRYGEGLSFQGDQSFLNPMRYLPNPYATKLWNVREPIEEYLNREYYGSSSRAWDSPVEDFVGPYSRGGAYRLTGVPILSGKNEYRRDLDTMKDQMQYLRSLDQAAEDPDNRSRYMAQASHTNIGANLFSSPDRLALTLPRRDRAYFDWFREETDPQKRSRILKYASPEMSRTLSGQWLKQDLEIAHAEGRTDMPITPYRGRPVGTEFIRQKADYQGRVVNVIDGDSLVIQDQAGLKEVRLSDANTPEMPTGAGRAAKDRTTKLALGRNVWVNVTQDSDKYGRQVGEVFTDDSRFLNDDLKKQGQAEDMRFSGGERFAQAPSEYQRSREIGEFFSRKGIRIPDAGSAAYDNAVDYEDVKLKILQEEGYNYHDFGIFQDRAAILHRKPAVDGAVAELSQPSGRSSERNRQIVEQMIASAYDKNARVTTTSRTSFGSVSTLSITTRYNPENDIRKDIRRNREKWQ